MISDRQYLQIASIIGSSSHCKRSQVGAILVKNGNIISFGYNGTISGFSNGCEDAQGMTLREVLHAESNMIAKLAKGSESSEGGLLYTTLAPCFDCCKLIIQAGIVGVYYVEPYRDMSGMELLKKANIYVERHDI
jgi:dCMP deaminase